MEDVSPVAVVVALLALLAVTIFLMSRGGGKGRLAQKSDSALRGLAVSAPTLYITPVLEVLAARKADLDWALPELMRLATSADPARSSVGWHNLGRYFGDRLAGLHLSNTKPTDSDRLWMREWLERQARDAKAADESAPAE